MQTDRVSDVHWNEVAFKWSISNPYGGEFSKVANFGVKFNGELKFFLRARGIKEYGASHEYGTLVHTTWHLALWSGWLAHVSFSGDSASKGQYLKHSQRKF
jgi:hypothetical protein